MRRRKLTLCAAVVAAGALAVPALGPTFATGDGSDLTIRLKAVTVSAAELDLGEEGFGVGDQFVFADDLFRLDKGRPTGEDGGSCTVVRADQAAQTSTVNCVATFSFPRGQVTVQGLVTFTAQERPFTVAVTGGTGRYQGVGGEAHIQPLSETETRVTLKLRFPKR